MSEHTPGPIVLVRMGDPENKPLLYACGKCGQTHSPRIYACGEERAHETAKQAAIDCYTCREHNECSYCGEQCPKGWTACDPCRLKRKLEAAVEMPDDGGPYCVFDGDTYFHEMEEAVDAGCEWVSPCTVTYPRLDIENVLEPLFDHMFEDAGVDDLNGVAELEAAIKAFNEAQTARTYFGDNKRKINAAKARTQGEPNNGR